MSNYYQNKNITVDVTSRKLDQFTSDPGRLVDLSCGVFRSRLKTSLFLKYFPP